MTLRSASLIILFTLVALSIFGPWLYATVNPDALSADLAMRLMPPSGAHWLGTDEMGRDFLLRLMQGGRISLLVAVGAAFLAVMIGTVIGLIAGTIGGWADTMLMRLTDTVIALPLLPLLIVLAAVDLTKLGFSADVAHSESVVLGRIVLIVALFGWTTPARLVRGMALAIREKDYVRAAIAMGASRFRLMTRHILPNLMGVLAVAATLAAGHVILFESVLSFLGVGVQPPTPSWGNMLTNAQEMIWSSPELAIYPGLAIFLTVICLNFAGDTLLKRKK
jgi:peptide/nickel transport system permease protein